jgi:hypothetical protein
MPANSENPTGRNLQSGGFPQRTSLMKRVTLVHWNAAEAAEKIKALRAAGFEPVHENIRGLPSLAEIRSNPPDAVVIDLGRLPSHGRRIALALKDSRAGRMIPIVFVGGEIEEIERLRTLLPDSTFATWRRIRTALLRAIRTPPGGVTVSVAPPAGYSGTPLPRKLGIKPQSRVALVSPPAGFSTTLGELPDGAQLISGFRGPVSLSIWFVRSGSELTAGIVEMVGQIGDSPMWIAWPKRGSGLETDLVQSTVREVALSHDLVDYKVCAIDATWSGLLFKRRRHQVR